MKNTLLALMLVSSLFVISCGADATKPGDAYKNQPTETVTGTRTRAFYANAGTVDLTTSYYSLDVGEKVTEIVQVTTTPSTGTGTKTTNTVTGTTKNADGGIYKFTINDAAFSGSARVTYKYIIREAAPMVEKETAGTYVSSTSPLTMNVSFTDEEKSFNKNVVSVTDKNGVQLTNDLEYTYDNYNTITIKKTGYYAGDAFKVKYTYRDISMISEKPLTDNVTVTPAVPGATPTATITLDAAVYAGRSCYLKAPLIWQQSSGGGSGETKATIYDNIVIPSTGIITINAPTTWTEITSGTYEIWVY